MGNCSLKLWRDSTSFPAETWCLFCCPASWARCLLWVSCVCLTKKFLDICLCRVAELILIWGGSVQPLVFLGTQGGCIVGSSDFQCPAGFGLDEFAEWSGGGLWAQGFLLCGKTPKPRSEELPNFESILREWMRARSWKLSIAGWIVLNS